MLATLLLNRGSPTPLQVNASAIEVSQTAPTPKLGPRLQLTYNQWVALLGREAKVAAEVRPMHLTVLAGDSLSLWFPDELLPVGRHWLNQGISGETSAGLLQRLKLFDQTQPDTVFVMIGINDLIRGVREETLLANQQEIIRHLKMAHPRSKLVVQSILPHAGDRLLDTTAPEAWASRLAAFSNDRIRSLNQQLAQIAKDERVNYLDLHPDFVDAQGNLRAELTTDGLHLSRAGYEVWRSRLQAVSLSGSQ
ncbi:G-D-S-L family lipolytic protein [Leptolyngbya sp. FACHB-36]|uniref:SGNH/GDSL hydrolase family protein n=1 Tax=Leptolyngbya sp. FACHB-36 TaxID=2692808 RepID=UPI0016807574|nr:SGNH/GDSL hydrolase family protein [Leptolyngbya sp. FACHB-36]MBD2022466.1 G-D-S-L family lipolytic protein [Leptolyngbya sp. FACHB-36]